MKTFKTSDIYLASYLLSQSFPIKNITTLEGKKYFNFGIEREPLIGGDSWTIDKAIVSYWNKTMPVEPLNLFSAFKELKNRIYNQ